MAYELRVGQGQLFRARSKKTDRSPDMTGKLMLPNGVLVYVSGWKKVTAAGEEWISLQLGNPVDQQQAHQNAVKDTDEQIPF